ncbi:MAG: TrbI/VirB10 family protein [Rickettsiales bacterium]|nr:TrbI/VirB10 family protein [Rickettsiales bacterium]
MPSTDGIDVAPPAPPPAPGAAPNISGGGPRTPFPNQQDGGKLAPIIFGNKPSRPSPSGGGSSPGGAGLSEAEQMEFARRNVSSIVLGGGGATASGGGGGGGSADGSEGVTSSGGGPSKSGGVTLFSSSSSTRNLGTPAPSKESRYIEDLYRIVAQGKIIDAVLETAINTDVPGLLRGVVTKDIFSEQGRNVLIPRGSRLIGSYSSDVERNQQRISVTWNRIIRPDGIDVEIDAPGADRLGRSGISGKVDNKYVELFGSTLMFGSIGASVALLSEQFTDSGGTTTTTTDGGTTNSSGTNVDVAVQEMVTNIGDVTEAISGELLDIEPTFTVNQGTVMKIFVTEDLVFSRIYLKR